ncbi:MAG: Clp1/GlmU family protein [Candidatus Bathyarchaeia archaeon]
MKQTVESGKTLLVDGPASVTVLTGTVEIFGFPVKISGRIVIREGKRLPFIVTNTAEFDVLLGENARIEEVEGSTIPHSWDESANTLLSFDDKPITALILGKSDSGKTSFCTYLINKLLSEKNNVAILDGDLGQADVGPPCSIAYTIVSKPITDLFTLKAENAFFVGCTSPSEAVDKTLNGFKAMLQEIQCKKCDFTIVNTDGWIDGEEAVNYKSRLAEIINPDIIFYVQQNDELTPLADAIEKFRGITVESPVVVRQRSREKRKTLRELGYAKYLANAKIRTWPLKLLQAEKQDTVQTAQSAERALLGLYDLQEKFLGIGVLHKFDSVRNTLKVFTPVSAKTAKIIIGKVRLDGNLKEFNMPF